MIRNSTSKFSDIMKIGNRFEWTTGAEYILQRQTELILALLLWISLLSTFQEESSPPNGIIFWLLTLFVASYIGAEIISLLNGPPLVGMLIGGFVLRNLFPYTTDYEVSATLRNIALTVILLRAGVGLDPKVLKKLSAVCFRLSFAPCVVETITIAITTHFILDLPWQWAFLLGFAISAVSPAVVIPGMLVLNEKKIGTAKGIPTLVMAASSVDDVLAITGFGVFLGIVFAAQSSLLWNLSKGPLEAIVGCVLGILVGVFLWWVPADHEGDDFASHSNLRLAITVFSGTAIVFGSREAEWSGVGPLAALTLSFVAALSWREKEYDVFVEDGLRYMWYFFQPFLFGLIGAEVSLASIEVELVAFCLICLVIGLVFRMITAALVVYGANLTPKEKLFIALAWLPKATVQAAVGPIALDLARKNNDEKSTVFAILVLNVAVLSIFVTAPLGSILVAITGPLLLNNDQNALETNNQLIDDENQSSKVNKIVSTSKVGELLQKIFHF